MTHYEEKTWRVVAVLIPLALLLFIFLNCGTERRICVSRGFDAAKCLAALPTTNSDGGDDG